MADGELGQDLVCDLVRELFVKDDIITFVMDFVSLGIF
jgi:hypothetical protein